MRYLGNKESIMNYIIKLLKNKGLLSTLKPLTFFDAFAGTGSVSDAVKSEYNLIVNDSLEWSTVYSKGRLYASDATFSKLGFDPFKFINSNKKIVKGFFYNNYSHGNSHRMYFTKYNAGRIDYIRHIIEVWNKRKLLNKGEYEYLLASLIESVSKISNTAGVYGAFLKRWDHRALNPLIFIKVPHSHKPHMHLHFYSKKIEDIIAKINTDILYMDPPYTQNQYGTQYHIFETLIKYDNPPISKITGSRPTGPMRSGWSKQDETEILFDKVLSLTRAKYVILSYSSDGLMSYKFIEASLQRYGIKDTYTFKKIPYKKYQNFKSRNTKPHYEYLFFIKMKNKNNIHYESPLNYSGSKYKIITPLIKTLPNNSTFYYNFYDVFGGGFNVGINIHTKNIIYNDLDFKVTDLIKSFKDYDTYHYIKYVKRIIKKFSLKPHDIKDYKALRTYYNATPYRRNNPRLLYTLIMYGFQQQIRFNSHLRFNNPVGLRWFNDRILEKFISFSRRIKDINVIFRSKSFELLNIPKGPHTFLYLDPPYRLTTGSYNDGKRGFKGWNRKYEIQLQRFILKRDKLGNNIMLSYIIHNYNEQKINDNFANWLKTHPQFKIHQIHENTGWSGHKRNEILVTNY